MNNSKEVIEKSRAAKLSPEEYLMKYHNIRWALINFDLDKLRI